MLKSVQQRVHNLLMMVIGVDTTSASFDKSILLCQQFDKNKYIFILKKKINRPVQVKIKDSDCVSSLS